MLKIQSVEIRQLFGMKSFKYEFNNTMPKVMAGSNGFGKSSLLKLISYYLNLGCDEFYISSDDRADYDFESMTINFENSRSISIHTNGNTKIAKFINDGVVDVEIDLGLIGSSGKYHKALCSHLQISELEGYPCVFIRANRAAPSKDFWHITRANKTTIENCLGIAKSIKSFSDFEKKYDYFINTFNSIINYDERALDKMNLLTELVAKKIIIINNSLVEKVNDELKDFYKNKAEQKNLALEEGRLTIIFNNRYLGSEELSTGEANLIVILFAINSLKDKYIFIDEPEISLHLVWQKNLFKILRQTDLSNDLLISTHSIYMIDEKLETGGTLTLL